MMKEVFMPDVKWFYPDSIEEVAEIARKESAVPHAGGTGLLMGGLKKPALIDMHGLDLRYIEDKGDYYEIGAMTTYSDCANQLPEDNILTKAAGYAASTPLRNRITIGGSLAMAPIWSDIIGPMVTHIAKVKLSGYSDEITAENYLKNADVRRDKIIEYIKLPKSGGRRYYHRETRTRFDYPMFTLSMFANEETARFVITGIKGKFARLPEVESAFLKGDNIENAVDLLELDFPSKMQANPEYLAQVARVEILRGIKSLGRGR